MPLYDFECNTCGQVFEELIFDDDEQVPCQSCGGMETFRKVAAPSPMLTNPFPYKSNAPANPAKLAALSDPRLNRTCPNKSTCSQTATVGGGG